MKLVALVIPRAELEAVAAINTAIRLGNASETAEELMNPEAQLPIVYQTAANLYQGELFSLQLQGGRVSKAARCRRRSLSAPATNLATMKDFRDQMFNFCSGRLEPRGAECGRGDAVSCRRAKRGA